MTHDTSTPGRYRFPTKRLSEVDFARLDEIREAIVSKARQEFQPEGHGVDVMMMASDDGSFFSTDDWAEDWRDRYINVLSILSRRISLAVVSAGFAIAGSNMMNSEAASGYGRATLGAAAVFGVWAAAANLFGSRGQR